MSLESPNHILICPFYMEYFSDSVDIASSRLQKECVRFVFWQPISFEKRALNVLLAIFQIDPTVLGIVFIFHNGTGSRKYRMAREFLFLVLCSYYVCTKFLPTQDYFMIVLVIVLTVRDVGFYIWT